MDQARIRSEEAVNEARKVGSAVSLAYALTQACTVDRESRSPEELQARADALIAYGFSFDRTFGTFWRGLALAKIGQTAEGIAQLQAGVEGYRETGSVQNVSIMLAALAEAEGMPAAST